jgi:hypothetical protein
LQWLNKKHLYVENVGGVDKDSPSTSHAHMLFVLIHTTSSFVLDVESVNL